MRFVYNAARPSEYTVARLATFKNAKNKPVCPSILLAVLGSRSGVQTQVNHELGYALSKGYWQSESSILDSGCHARYHTDMTLQSNLCALWTKAPISVTSLSLSVEFDEHDTLHIDAVRKMSKSADIFPLTGPSRMLKAQKNRIPLLKLSAREQCTKEF